jgi:hypothetical protein
LKNNTPLAPLKGGILPLNSPFEGGKGDVTHNFTRKNAIIRMAAGLSTLDKI